MSFITLAERFEQSAQDIYTRFSAKERTNDQPYVSIVPDTPDSRNAIKDDTRSVPTVSTSRDRTRISRFLSSSDGRLFVSNQSLLQTGNTFVQTRQFNSNSILQNVRPFAYARRHVSSNELKNIAFGGGAGLLQNDTVDTLTTRFIVTGAINTAVNVRRQLTNSLLQPQQRQQILGRLKTAVLNAGANLIATKLKKEVNKYIPQTIQNSRPEYKVFGYTLGINSALTGATGPVIFDPQPLDQRGTVRTVLRSTVKAQIQSTVRKEVAKLTITSLNRLLPTSLRKVVSLPTPSDFETNKTPTFVQSAIQFRQNFYDNQLKKFSGDTTNNRLKNKYFDESNNGVFDQQSTDPSSGIYGTAKSGLTDLKDPFNKTKQVSTREINKLNYNNIIKNQPRNSDIIKFIFKEIDNSNPIHFRALLSTIKESIKPEFNEQRYVGRTERFVTYGGAKRGVNLSFNIVAFSQDEIEGMWSRINYLSGLAFPKNAKNGFMVPPMFKMTIGAIYDNQPCYIESLDYDFLDETITFDINQEVPFVINVNMQVSILEKRTKFYDSPFYKITEDLTDRQTSIPTIETARRLDNLLRSIPNQIDTNVGDVVGNINRAVSIRTPTTVEEFNTQRQLSLAALRRF